MTRRLRLDAELTRRGLTSSRTEARRVIEEGRVVVAGFPVTRPATLVTEETAISLQGPAARFVSRGGDKLDGALRRFSVAVEKRRWLDAGASTGGFTDRLLQGGAASVVAVDVGYGQFDWRLRNDARVFVLERTNARALEPQHLPWPVDGVVADLSFISLTTVLPALVRVARADADFILLVKPQFEVGRDAVGKGGVVREPELWRAAVERVARAASDLGLRVVDATVSRTAGPAGNREFFLHLRRGTSPHPAAIAGAVEEAARGRSEPADA